MLMLMLPLVVLFEGSILLPPRSTGGASARRAREEAELADSDDGDLDTHDPDSTTMLFDLRGCRPPPHRQGRLLLLALLMGGGLVGFGIGGAGLGGGLVDAITGSSGGGTGDRHASRSAARRPRGAAPWPTRRTRGAGRRSPAPATSAAVGENFRPEHAAVHTTAGKAQLQMADDAGSSYLALEPEAAGRRRRQPDDPGLQPGASNDADKAVAAQEIITERPDPRPTFATARRSSPTRPARPARATSRRDKALDLAGQGPRTRSRTRSTRPSSRRSRPAPAQPTPTATHRPSDGPAAKCCAATPL